jgi:hypothetical protein
MLNIEITRNTASSFKFTISSQVSFSKAKLWLGQGSDTIELDMYDATTEASVANVIKVNVGTGEITVDLNRLPFDSIYYKSFYMQFIDSNDIEVDRTVVFQISPKGKESLYGIVNKLSFDFAQMANFSGTKIRIFTRSLLESKCPKCWDAELEQPIASTCDCGGSVYHTEDILCRKVKTQSKQEYDDTGSKIRESVVFQTYARSDFIKGVLFADLGSKEIYEVTDRTIANIGGVRTSTMFIGTLIKPNDARVSGVLDLLD